MTLSWLTTAFDRFISLIAQDFLVCTFFSPFQQRKQNEKETEPNQKQRNKASTASNSMVEKIELKIQIKSQPGSVSLQTLLLLSSPSLNMHTHCDRFVK